MVETPDAREPDGGAAVAAVGLGDGSAGTGGGGSPPGVGRGGIRFPIGHLPVAGEKRLLGLLSIGDVIAYDASKNKQMVHYLTEYMYGRH